MSMTHAAILIILIAAIAWLRAARCRKRPAVEAGPTPRTEAMRSEVRTLGERLAVLERISDEPPGR